MNDPTEQSGGDQTVALGTGRLGEQPRLPLRLDAYMLTELLGQGAMGRVYKADQLEPVRREVAVKMLAAEHLDADLVARFEAERQALARMNHPNIAGVFDAGRSEGGQPYLVMEYAPGLTLLEYCNGHALGLDARLDLFHGICSALAHAHQKGVIHRDIKPSNILVTEEDGVPTAKVIDFGLAKALGGQLADRSLHTHAGTVLGTPAYMSPEQASLSGEDVDVRTDIYALGLVLYELLTGTLPFKRLGRDSTIEQVLRAVREDEPMRTSQRVASLAPGTLPAGLDPGIVKRLREDLDWIILKCLEKQPEDRYQSANALIADLERYRRHQPVSARRSTAGYLIAKGLRRYRVPLAVGAVIVLLAGVLGGGWLKSRSDAAAQARAAQRFGQSVQRIDSRLRVAHLIPAHDISVTRAQVSATLADLRARLPAMEAWAKGPAHYAIGRGLLALGEPREALAELRAAWDGGYQEASVAYALGLAYGRIYSKEQYKLANVTNPERRAERLRQAQAAYRDPALEFLHRGAAAGIGSADYGKALIAFYEKDYPRARTLAEKAIAGNPWLYEAVVLIGNTWAQAAADARRSGNKDQAIAAYHKAEQAFARAARIGQSDISPYMASCSVARDHLRLIQYGSGSDPEPVFEAGQAACQQAVAINPNSAAARARLANLTLIHGQIAEEGGADPLPIYTKVLDIAAAAIKAEPQDAYAYFVAGTAWQRIAIYQLNYGDKSPVEALAQSARYYRQAHELDPDRNDIYNELGNVYSIRGEYIAKHGNGDPMPDLLAAAENYKEGMRINPDHLIIHTNMAFNDTIIANYKVRIGDDPTPWFDRAFATYQRVLKDNPNLLLARINLADTAYHRGVYAASQGGDPLPWWRQATEQAQKVIASDPKNYFALGGLVEIWAERAAWRQQHGLDPTKAAHQAIEAGHKTMAIRATADTLFFQAKALGVLARSHDDDQGAAWRRQAVAALERAVALDPQHDKAQTLLQKMRVTAAH